MPIIKRVQFDPPNPVEIFYVDTVEVNGQTIETPWRSRVTGINYQSFLSQLQAEIDADSPTPVTNWLGFNTQMWQDAAYRRIRGNTSDQVSASQLESLALTVVVGLPLDLTIFATLWNSAISGSETQPTAEEAQGWQAIASANNMPFSFNGSGLIGAEEQEEKRGLGVSLSGATSGSGGAGEQGGV